MGFHSNATFLNQLPKINSTVNFYLMGWLVVYICVISRYEPEIVINLVNYPLSRLIIILGIIWFAQNHIITAILLAVALVITININSVVRLAELNGIQTEHFTAEDEGEASDSESESNSDSDSESNSESESSESNTDEDSDDEDGDSDDEDGDSDDGDGNEDSDNESVESFVGDTVTQDDFTRLHNAIHQFDQFLTEK